MQRGISSTFRLALVCVCILSCFGGIATRLVYLQVIERGELLSQVERARKRVQVINARRGEIRDRNGNLLATNRSFIEVGLDPQTARATDEALIPELARLLAKPETEVRAAFERKTVISADGRQARQVRWTRLAESVDEQTYDEVMRLQIKGVYGNRQFRRNYPMGSLAAHVVGFVNHDNVAAMGVERHLDFYLRGQDGWFESELDGLRRELPQFRSREVQANDGYNVVLSIDSVVQDLIERELREIVAKYNPVGATIIVSDPRDGFILGLANFPSFNPNSFNKPDPDGTGRRTVTDILDSHRNRAVTDIFEPGSTFKIVAASAALNEGLVTPETNFDCSNSVVTYRGRSVRLPRDTSEYGVLPVSKIVAKSSNRGAAQLGMLLGEDRLYRYSSAFGFGQPSGFALGGEVGGMLHPVREWDGLTISRLPMGHAVGVTPMQIHYAMAAIANDGVLLRPQVVRRIVDHNGSTVLDFQRVERRQVIRPETARTMRRLLVQAAQPEGTAPMAQIPDFEVAGKTGTTQKIVDGRYSRSHHVGSFIGFFPASQPRVVVSVIIDDARLSGTAYGSTVAAPAFRDIAEQLIQYLGISPPSKPLRAGLAAADANPHLAKSRDRLR